MTARSDDFEVLISAEEAWPTFERAVLHARTEVLCGFRIFDFTTRLRSPEAKAIGETWFDLIEHVVRRGVVFQLSVSDFDPVMATELHESAWRTKRQAAALAEALGMPAKDRLRVRADLHPAKAGTIPWLVFLPLVMSRLKSRLRHRRPVRLRREAIGLRGGALPDLHPVSHHHKLAVIDREFLYIGGLDLNERRFDTKSHSRPAKATWSDVQLTLTGTEAKEAAEHLLGFRSEIVRETPPRKGQFLCRTLSSPRRRGFLSLSPKTLLDEIEDHHLSAFRTARHMIHIETQFFRSTKLARGLARAARKNPDLRLFLVLPALPEDVAFEHNSGLDARYGMALQADCLEHILTAFRDRACIATPVQMRMAARETRTTLAGSPVIHVHNKVLVVDDRSALVGSANLNGRSMKWDTEVALKISTERRVAALRKALFAHWLQADVPKDAMNPRTSVTWWQDRIARNAVSIPERRAGLLVPHDPEQLEHLQQHLPGVTEDIV